MGARELDYPDLEAITPAIAREIQKALRGGLSPLQVEPPLSLSAWAAKHFFLSAESSQKRERWTPWPFQPGIMDAMSNDAIEEVDVPKSARVGYTKMLLACIAYDAHHKRRNQAIWQPTDDDSASFTKTELEPALRDIGCMQQVFPSYLAKSKDNTLQLKRFLGSVLHMLGGKAAKNYRRITIASAKLDEIDGFDRLIERSADPVTLAWKRLEGATFKKLIVGSTPRIKGESHIEGRHLAADARMRYQVACKHCGCRPSAAVGRQGQALRHQVVARRPYERPAPLPALLRAHDAGGLPCRVGRGCMDQRVRPVAIRAGRRVARSIRRRSVARRGTSPSACGRRTARK
jgi:phage terminase large subunit GpA-like protein